MALRKYRLGQLIEIVDERNSDGSITDFYGININKEFMPTAANTDGVDATKYKIVRKNRFVFSGMQTGRDVCIRIGLYTEDNPIIVSPAYITFEIIQKDLILDEYLMTKFMSREMDRFGWFISDSSVRSNLDWDRFCDIEMELPDITIQQKYVNIYNALLQNQKSYERGMDDLKLTCDAYIEKLRHELPLVPIGGYIEESNTRKNNVSESDVRGISIEKKFIETKAELDGVNINNYKTVCPKGFAFVSVTSRNGEKISIAFNGTEDTYVVSSTYIVFDVIKREQVLPEYLNINLNRSEFDRYARFHSWGSARETFTFDDMKEVQIPVPPIAVQQAIVNIFNAYSARKNIREKLKASIRDTCPILIRGAMEEGKCHG
jgi:type I restriction enzyme S subunit